MHITIASEAEARHALPQLISLLVDAVNHNASIGFLPPMDESEAAAYWAGQLEAVGAGIVTLFLAWDGRALAGTVQLRWVQYPNGYHRAEPMKLMVHTKYRRRGIGLQLMLALENYALENNRTLLVLDTRQGDDSELLYQKLGYIEAGKIPQYVISETGNLDATVLYYKILG